jgi:hypothetical protein
VHTLPRYNVVLTIMGRQSILLTMLTQFGMKFVLELKNLAYRSLGVLAHDRSKLYCLQEFSKKVSLLHNIFRNDPLKRFSVDQWDIVEGDRISRCFWMCAILERYKAASPRNDCEAS